MIDATWHLKQSRSPFTWKQWFAVCIAANGLQLCRTSETYFNRADCLAAVELSRRALVEGPRA